jgi:hypothetical protein
MRISIGVRAAARALGAIALEAAEAVQKVGKAAGALAVRGGQSPGKPG